MSSLRKNVASQNITFQLNAKADGTPVTAGGAGNVSKDGGAQAACSGTFTHLGTGQWNYAPTQAETNATAVGFQFTGTGAINVNLHFFTDNWDTTQPVLTSGSGANQINPDGSGNVPLSATTENAIADALLDRANGIETGVTPRQAIRYGAAAVTGVLAGAATTNITIAAIGNAGTNRITATVDSNGNRSAITLA